MIEDKELRELFKAESAEHVQSLESKLLYLEKTPEDKAALDTALREAHSLKGSARMLGVKDVERVAHRLEDMLGAARSGKTALTPPYLDFIYKGVDAIKKLVNEAVTGEPANVNVTGILENRPGAPQPEEAKEVLRPLAAASGAVAAPAKNAPVEQAAPQQGAYRIDTIRVETKKLDELMTHSGELTVIRTRMARLLGRIDELMALADISSTRAFNIPAFNPGAGSEKMGRLAAELASLREEAYEDNSRIEFVSASLENGIRDIRLLPFSTLFNFFPRMVRDMARERAKDAELEIVGGDVKADKRIIEELKDPVMHIIRNSIDHGIELPQERGKANKPRTGKIRLSARRTDTNIIVEAADDGGGLDIESIKKTAAKRKIRSMKELDAMSPAEITNLIFTPGFSTSAFVTDVSGRGIGLDVARANVERLKGTIHVESTAGAGCLFRIRLPITLATARVLLVLANGATYAIPLESVDTTRRVTRKEIFHIEGRDAVVEEHRTISAVKLEDILGLPKKAEKNRQPAGKADIPMTCVILSAAGETVAVIVDDLLDEQEVVLKPPSPVLKRVRNVSGSTILGSGEICPVLNPNDMVVTVRKRTATAAPEETKEARKKPSVLLVEDSISTRTQEKRILESGGYEVFTAVNGVDAWAKLATRSFDAVISDVMMPEMDGLALTARIRQNSKYKELPVILVTTLSSDEDKKRGLEAGANAYIPKPSFDQKILLETLGRLV
ncbi:MAG: hybrid sensor histidine kinase/response regulator [Candidatus Nitrosotenuis sp.]|nr:MAG: hybrid sensor histidine kinase/response regulator [Candidatus Nitrosotenuis sp.]